MMQNTILPLTLSGLCLNIDDKPLISGIDLTIDAGQTMLILGANGAGKSLLLRLCHGLIAPSAGQVIWADGSARATAQAMVFQRPVMLRRSVRANLDHALALQNIARSERSARIDGALDRFGLTALADRGARLLSGGEQQRLALARAWLTQPQILFLDEPCSALDPGASRMIEQIIQDFKAEGITLVMTTHDLGQARRLADRVVFLHQGQILETAAAPEFFSAPTTPQARAFLAGDLLW